MIYRIAAALILIGMTAVVGAVCWGALVALDWLLYALGVVG